MGNVAEAGVSSAQRAREVRDALKTAAVQRNLASYQAAHLREQANREMATTRLIDQQREFERINQPFSARLAAAEAILSELQIPRAQNEAWYETKAGRLAPVLRGISGAAGAAALFGGGLGFGAKVIGGKVAARRIGSRNQDYIDTYSGRRR